MNRSGASIATVTGDDLLRLIPDLAGLRIRVFSDYPYLYVGTTEYEASYLRQFAAAPHAVVVTARDGDGNVIGCATGSSLQGHHAEFSRPLADAGYPLDDTFYFGESVLEAEWRGQGIGHGFFDAREAHALRLGYRRACFCAVIRQASHPLRPAHYTPLDAFWQRRGYRRLPDVETVFNWPEATAGPDVGHPMAYWLREFQPRC